MRRVSALEEKMISRTGRRPDGSRLSVSIFVPSIPRPLRRSITGAAAAAGRPTTGDRRPPPLGGEKSQAAAPGAPHFQAGRRHRGEGGAEAEDDKLWLHREGRPGAEFTDDRLAVLSAGCAGTSKAANEEVPVQNASSPPPSQREALREGDGGQQRLSSRIATLRCLEVTERDTRPSETHSTCIRGASSRQLPGAGELGGCSGRQPRVRWGNGVVGSPERKQASKQAKRAPPRPPSRRVVLPSNHRLFTELQPAKTEPRRRTVTAARSNRRTPSFPLRRLSRRSLSGSRG